MAMSASLLALWAVQAPRWICRWGRTFCVLLALIVLEHPVWARSLLDEKVADPVSLSVSWCATDPQLVIDAVVQGACTWQVLERSQATQGLDSRAFWLKLDFRNASSEPIERWLELGHPQMAEVTLFAPRGHRWERREIGMQVPLNQRGSIEEIYGVLPVTLPADSVQTFWIRIASDTVVVLRSRHWDPNEFRARLQNRQIWSSIGIGGLVLTIFFSLLMMVLNRQSAYGYFALGLTGSFVTSSVVSGIFQRFFWPGDWPLNSSIRDLGALITIFGFYRFLWSFLPNMRRYGLLCMFFRIAAYNCFFFLLARLAGLRGVDIVWFFAMAVCGLAGSLICARSWMEGDRAAGIMTVAFGVLVVFSLVRLLVMSGVVEFVPEISQIPFVGIFLITPLMLLGLVDRTRQLQDKLSRVQAENAAQLFFLAQMSHELRSPLDNVLGNTQLLAREVNSPSQISGIKSIFDSGRQLLRIIDHILDYARGSAGMLKIEPAPLHLGTFFRGIERMARLLAVQRNNRFEFRFQGPEQSLQAVGVMADAERLRQVLGNLLGNAARHTSDGVITLEVSGTRLPGSKISLDFRVADTGDGISEQDQVRIFRPFERAENTVMHSDKGAGLGLAIARQMVELMGGNLSVRSTLGQGASFRFSITVPLLSAGSITSSDRLDGFDAAGYQGPRRMVLVVDDEDASRTVLGQLLAGLGFEVALACSGSEVQAMLTRLQALDLVITDQYMPDGDGWLVLERVHAEFPEVPVIMISAAPPSPPLDWNPRLRFAAQFLRPVDHAQLLARIGDLLDLNWTETDPDAAVHRQSVEEALSALASPGITQEMTLPSAAHLQVLAQLVELGQVTAIEEWASRVLAERAEYAPFVEQVLQAVRRLDFQTLLCLAGSAGADPEP